MASFDVSSSSTTRRCVSCGRRRTKFEQQRRVLNVDERQARLALKAAMEDSAGRDQSKISQSLDQLVAAQRRRADLLEAEQKELATFLTPFQRAQYLSLQERLVRRLLDGPKAAPGTAPDSLPLGALSGEPRATRFHRSPEWWNWWTQGTQNTMLGLIVR